MRFQSSRFHCVASSAWPVSAPSPLSISWRSAGPTAGMVRRRIAKPSIPGHRPDEPERPEQREQRPPAEIDEQRRDQQGSQPAGEVHAHEKNALRRAALLPRKPARERAGGVGQRPGFAGAEQKPDPHQRRVAEREAREHGERRPPADDPRQHPPRADPIAPPAGGNLERRVGQIERAEHIPHLRRTEIEIARDVGPGHRNADPIEIGDGRQHHRHAPALCSGHACPLAAPCWRGRNSRGSKNRNDVETLSMLNSAAWRIRGRRCSSQSRNTGRRKPRFVSAPGLACLSRAGRRGRSRGGPARDARRVCDRRPATVHRSAVRRAAGRVESSRDSASDTTASTSAKPPAAGLLCTNTPGVLNQSVAEHTMLLVAAAARPLLSTSANMARHVWDPAPGRGAAGEDTRDRRVRWHRARGRAHRRARIRHAGRGLFQAGRAAARGAGAL